MKRTPVLHYFLSCLLLITASVSSFHAAQHTAITSHDHSHEAISPINFASYLPVAEHHDSHIPLSLLDDCSECLLLGALAIPPLGFSANDSLAQVFESRLMKGEIIVFGLSLYSPRAPPILLV